MEFTGTGMYLKDWLKEEPSKLDDFVFSPTGHGVRTFPRRGITSYSLPTQLCAALTVDEISNLGLLPGDAVEFKRGEIVAVNGHPLQQHLLTRKVKPVKRQSWRAMPNRIRHRLDLGGGLAEIRLLTEVVPVIEGGVYVLYGKPGAKKTTMVHRLLRALREPGIVKMIGLIDERTHEANLLDDLLPEEVPDGLDLTDPSLDIVDVITATQGVEAWVSTTRLHMYDTLRFINLMYSVAIQRALRGARVVLVLDSLVRWVNVNNMLMPSSGGLSSGGQRPDVIANVRSDYLAIAGHAPDSMGGGSITIIATALDRPNDAFFRAIKEEIAATVDGNVELNADKGPLPIDWRACYNRNLESAMPEDHPLVWAAQAKVQGYHGQVMGMLLQKVRDRNEPVSEDEVKSASSAAQKIVAQDLSAVARELNDLDHLTWLQRFPGALELTLMKRRIKQEVPEGQGPNNEDFDQHGNRIREAKTLSTNDRKQGVDRSQDAPGHYTERDVRDDKRRAQQGQRSGSVQSQGRRSVDPEAIPGAKAQQRLAADWREDAAVQARKGQPAPQPASAPAPAPAPVQAAPTQAAPAATAPVQRSRIDVLREQEAQARAAEELAATQAQAAQAAAEPVEPSPPATDEELAALKAALEGGGPPADEPEDEIPPASHKPAPAPTPVAPSLPSDEEIQAMAAKLRGGSQTTASPAKGRRLTWEEAAAKALAEQAPQTAQPSAEAETEQDEEPVDEWTRKLLALGGAGLDDPSQPRRGKGQQRQGGRKR